MSILLTKEILNRTFQQIRDDRWICKGCGLTSGDPYRPPQVGDPVSTYRISACPDCGGHDWHNTTRPIPKT